ncbi:MAG: hypothetical protein JKY49_00465 [Cohaesibacteraceae bacterium]|nr:hypothetical protein [Cohaesibacteraceae bacterium]MBL4875772.1 hypothetical protein [Cohaesibacteraceae bacterium]
MAAMGGGLGLLQGAASASAKQDAANKNIAAQMVQTSLDYQQSQRELIVESEAASEQANDAWLKMESSKATVSAGSAGTQGSTVGARLGEQSRQGGLSISRAYDRKESAQANHQAETKAKEIEGNNYIATQHIDPMTSMFEIAAGGFKGWSRFAKL